MIALLALAPAFAQQDASLCRDGFSDDDWRARLQSARGALGTLDLEGARAALDRTRQQLVCLDHVADPVLLAELALDLAWLAFIDQDEVAAVRWLLVARGAAPDVTLPGSVPAGLSALDAETADPRLVGPDGRLVPPKGGGVFLDGELLLEPRAAAEVPGLLQVADGKGQVLTSVWIDSGNFPEEWLGPAGPPPKPPRWLDRGVEEPVAAERGGGGPSIGRLVASGGLAVLAGTLYGLGAMTSGGLADATTEDALAAARSRTNALAMGSMALGAGALGVGVAAFVPAHATVGFSVRF